MGGVTATEQNHRMNIFLLDFAMWKVSVISKSLIQGDIKIEKIMK